eukprot:582537-Rhodomonas_salina.5
MQKPTCFAAFSTDASAFWPWHTAVGQYRTWRRAVGRLLRARRRWVVARYRIRVGAYRRGVGA